MDIPLQMESLPEMVTTELAATVTVALTQEVDPQTPVCRTK